jgi:hypothetical protein
VSRDLHSVRIQCQNTKMRNKSKCLGRGRTRPQANFFRGGKHELPGQTSLQN